jgi:adenylate cyclase
VVDRRRLAAIMFTDTAGSTAAAHSDEAGALRRFAEQETLLRPTFQRFGGREVKSTGDGFLVEFESSLEAAKCGVEIQRQLRERNDAHRNDPVLVRIGIHLGDVEQRGDDIFGDSVNIAARVESFSEPGGVCLSEQVFAQVKNKLSERIETLGPRTLKGVPEPITLYRITVGSDEPVLPGDAGEPRLAVLPLSNISPDAADEYFADGMTEELIATLSKLPGLVVISRTSVMPYKGRSKGVPEIGRELKVASVVEGSVRKAGNRIRITVQLIDAATDRHLWAETYDRTLDDVFAVQAEIAEKIAAALRIRLLERDERRLDQVPTADSEAHLLYLRARFENNRGTEEGFRAAMELLEKAVRLDPDYAAAYAYAARIEGLAGFFGWVPAAEAVETTRRFAEKALALDDSLVLAHLAQATVLESTWDFDGADRAVRRAVALDPRDAEARTLLAYGCGRARQFEAAWEHIEAALALAPEDLRVREEAATWLLYTDRAARAAALYEEIVARNPTKMFSTNNLGLAHLRMGELRRGLAEIEEVVGRDREMDLGRQADLAYALARNGEAARARATVEAMERHYAARKAGATWLAAAWGAVGEKEKAFEWLERAYEERSPSLGALLGIDFGLDALRSDSRFLAFAERVGHPVARQRLARSASAPQPPNETPDRGGPPQSP